jgi:hypothetical protein
MSKAFKFAETASVGQFCFGILRKSSKMFIYDYDDILLLCLL